jgi:nucleotide-binding universal stress UspA family protein
MRTRRDAVATGLQQGVAMKGFRRILVPHDFSEHATRALRVAADLAREHRGRLLVLHVITPFHPVTAFPAEQVAWPSEADLVPGERRHLEALVARVVKGRSRPPVTCKVEIGDPYHRIVDAARGVDLIVMSTAGRTGLAHLLVGSVAEKVVRHAPVPVLTLRPAPAKKRGRARGRRRSTRRR